MLKVSSASADQAGGTAPPLQRRRGGKGIHKAQHLWAFEPAGTRPGQRTI